MNGPRPEYKYILSIDIGIKHLALLLTECTKEYIFEDIVWFELIDITRFHHLDDDAKRTCNLYHSKTIADWLSHVMYLHGELFDMVDHILIERQPPQGHTSVEQILFFKYRDKAILISPRSVHKFFGWTPDIDYEQRKEKSVQILKYRLEKSSRDWLLPQLDALTRQHDISDAFIQTCFFLHYKYISERLVGQRGSNSHELSFLDKFTYKSKFYCMI